MVQPPENLPTIFEYLVIACYYPPILVVAKVSRLTMRRRRGQKFIMAKKRKTDLLTRDKKERLKLCTTQSTGILTKKKKKRKKLN